MLIFLPVNILCKNRQEFVSMRERLNTSFSRPHNVFIQQDFIHIMRWSNYSQYLSTWDSDPQLILYFSLLANNAFYGFFQTVLYSALLTLMIGIVLTLLQTGWGWGCQPKAQLCPCRQAAGPLERTETDTKNNFVRCFLTWFLCSFYLQLVPTSSRMMDFPQWNYNNVNESWTDITMK